MAKVIKAVIDTGFHKTRQSCYALFKHQEILGKPKKQKVWITAPLLGETTPRGEVIPYDKKGVEDMPRLRGPEKGGASTQMTT